jgi:hypothetical protein
MSSPNGPHEVIYYPKFHCELNHIEHFWCHCKGFARSNCEYSLEKLRVTVPAALSSVKNSTILGNYERCRRKMELYRLGIAYGSREWQKKTSHQKTYSREEDR